MAHGADIDSKQNDYIDYIDYMGAWPHGMRIDSELNDYIDYIDYRPAASGQRPAGQRGQRPAPWCCRPCALRPAPGGQPALRPGSAEAGGGRAERLGPQLRSGRKHFLFL